MVVDKTRDSTNSKIWPDSTCAISVRRKGQILLVVESLVLSATLKGFNVPIKARPNNLRYTIWTIKSRRWRNKAVMFLKINFTLKKEKC